jgi:lactate permease
VPAWTRALLAALPVLTVFALIGSQRVASWKAALVGAALAATLAITAWSLPWRSAVAAAGYGAASALFPIVYIIWTSLLLYQLTVATGWAERLRASLADLAADRDLLLLGVGFGFTAFLDSTAGFLTPVTVGTALLAGLGVPALQAAAYTLVASSLPPIFGAMGIPVLVMADVAEVPLEALARIQAGVAAVLFVPFPAWLTLTFGGTAALRRLWLPSLAAGFAYAAALWWTATRVGVYPAGLAAALAAVLAVGVVGGQIRSLARTGGLWRAAVPWWPYWILMACVVAWSLAPVSRVLGRLTVRVPIPGLPGTAWKLDALASPGTAILAATGAVALLAGASRDQVVRSIRLSAFQIRYALVSMAAMFALAQLMNASGMTATLGQAVAGAQRAFAFLSPFLSWFGAAVAGSNTASHALLARLQAVTAGHLGLEPLLVLALAGGAAPLGKMVAPQVVSAAAAAGNLEGAEGRLLRTGLAHSLLWTAAIGVAGLALTR